MQPLFIFHFFLFQDQFIQAPYLAVSVNYDSGKMKHIIIADQRC